MPTEADRFWAKVRESGDCWEWVAGTDRDGYGRFRNAAGRKVAAHRWAYEYMVAEIPTGLQLDHLCRVPQCVNPAHLEPVTSAENTRRGLRLALGAYKTHCKWGHEFTPENTRPNSSANGRSCVTCNRRRVSERYHRLKNAQ